MRFTSLLLALTLIIGGPSMARSEEKPDPKALAKALRSDSGGGQSGIPAPYADEQGNLPQMPPELADYLAQRFQQQALARKQQESAWDPNRPAPTLMAPPKNVPSYMLPPGSQR